MSSNWAITPQKETKNISCAKDEGAVDHIYQMIQEISFGFSANFDDQV